MQIRVTERLQIDFKTARGFAPVCVMEFDVDGTIQLNAVGITRGVRTLSYR